MRRAQPGRAHLQHLPEAQGVLDVDLRDPAPQLVLAARLSGRGQYERAAVPAAPALHQALVLEHLQHLAQGDPADPQPLGQLALGRQPLAAGDQAQPYDLEDLLQRLLEAVARAHRPQHRCQPVVGRLAPVFGTSPYPLPKQWSSAIPYGLPAASEGGRRIPWQTAHPRSRVEELSALVASGEIDTVVLAFPDMQGRLQGKRFAARFFLDEVLEHGTEGCNYLLAVDTEMNTVDGYAMSSWERGYGDFAMHPDLATLRRVPWNEGTALLIADLAWNDGSPVVAAPRQILRRQLERLAEHGCTAHVGTELEFIVFKDTYEQAWDARLPRPDPGQPVQHRLLGPRHRPDRAAAAPHPQRDGARPA